MLARVPLLMRLFMRGALTRRDAAGERAVYLTFDDGPIPEATPFVLDALREQQARATFFVVGDNIRKYPHLKERILAEGHALGNHTMHHLQGLHTAKARYLADVEQADGFLDEPARGLFRPPHGLMRPAQRRALQAQGRSIVLHDVLTRDYARRLDAAAVLARVKRYTRPGSIIVFHDSLRSIGKLRQALPEALAWLRARGYDFRTL